MPYSLLVVFANAKFVKFDIILGESGPQKPKYWSGRLVDCTTGIKRKTKKNMNMLMLMCPTQSAHERGKSKKVNFSEDTVIFRSFNLDPKHMLI